MLDTFLSSKLMMNLSMYTAETYRQVEEADMPST